MRRGWELAHGPEIPESLVAGFVRPALDAVPASMARRLGRCRIRLRGEIKPGVASRWRLCKPGLVVSVATADVEDHDVAMEVLRCLAQALWEKLLPAELNQYGSLLEEEIASGVEAEIDEEALEAKRLLSKSRSHARGMERLADYVRASFAATAAEYVHCLWHDVTVRTGPEFLAPAPLRRRLELLARWFPPGRGYRLFPGGARSR